MYLLPEAHKFITIYCSTCGKSHVIIQVCKNRYCPHCGHIRRWRSRERIRQVLQNHKKLSGYRLKMLTLAGKNCADLKPGLEHLVASFRRMRQSKFWRSHIVGGLFVIEITGSPGSWHPHIHAFIYSKRVPWDGLLAIWDKASSGGRSVWIANISNEKALYYVTKYVTKTGIPAILADELNDALQGKRLFQRFGNFQDVKIMLNLQGKKCTICGQDDWLTEFDINRFKDVNKQPPPIYSRPVKGS